jgi:hypothetical protein
MSPQGAAEGRILVQQTRLEVSLFRRDQRKLTPFGLAGGIHQFHGHAAI